MNITRKCHENNCSISVTIPSEICRKYRIEKGTVIDFKDMDGIIELRVLKPIEIKEPIFEAEQTRERIRKMHEEGILSKNVEYQQ